MTTNPITLITLHIIFILSYIVSSRRHANRNTNIPRVGPPGPLGYAWTVLRSILDSEGLVAEGQEKFGGKAFILPSASGEWIVLGPSEVEVIKRNGDEIFNAPLRAKQLFQPNVQFGDITTNPYHLETIIRSDLTKALKDLVPEMLEEAQLTIPEKLGFRSSSSSVSADANASDSGSESVTVSLFPTIISIVARVSNRAMIGVPGCRNEQFLKRQVSVAEQAIPMGQILGWFPEWARTAVWKMFSAVAGSKDDAVRLLKPYVVERIKYAQQENPQVIVDLLLRYAPEEETDLEREYVNGEGLDKLTVRVVHLNMASIHTSSIFTTHALFTLARLPPFSIEAIRNEITAAIASEGGLCNKAAVDKFYMLDSLLKEIGRWESLFAVGSSRLVMKDAVLSDGTLVPAGSVVSFAPKPMHMNPSVYADPDVFDPFRFSKARGGAGEGGEGVKSSFTAMSNNYMVFGIGKHACPGRFFAALKIKTILADILLNYDVSYPEGASHHPKSFSFNIFTVPNPTASLTFTRRSNSNVSAMS